VHAIPTLCNPSIHGAQSMSCKRRARHRRPIEYATDYVLMPGLTLHRRLHMQGTAAMPSLHWRAQTQCEDPDYPTLLIADVAGDLAEVDEGRDAEEVIEKQPRAARVHQQRVLVGGVERPDVE